MRLENYEMHLPSYSIGDQCYSKVDTCKYLCIDDDKPHFFVRPVMLLCPHEISGH